MKFAVIQFPGSNCDQDCLRAINGLDGLSAEYVWHKATSLAGFDAIVLPGGFAYGDYLRCGAIARFSPIMNEVVRAAKEGRLVLGTCNGFQVLCEAGLLPGTLVRMPIAHGEGCYFADANTLRELNANGQVVMRYCDGTGATSPESNPNGSIENIAGICNREGNVFGLMPHPDRACEARLGSADGLKIFQSMIETIDARRARAA